MKEYGQAENAVRNHHFTTLLQLIQFNEWKFNKFFISEINSQKIQNQFTFLCNNTKMENKKHNILWIRRGNMMSRRQFFFEIFMQQLAGK